jgi:phage-related protein
MAAGWIASAAAMIVAMAPILAIAAAIAALIAFVVLLWTHWDQIWGWIMAHKAYAAIIAILGGPVVAIGLVVGAVKTLWDNWNQIWTWIQDKVQTVWGVIRGIWDALRAAVGVIVSTVQGLLAVWSSVWSLLGTYVETAWHVIAPVWATIKTGLGLLVDAINIALAVWSGAWGAIGGAVSSVWNGVIKPIFTAIVNGVQWVIDQIKRIPSAAASAAKAVAGSIPIIGPALSGLGGLIGLDSGGVVPGPVGQAVPAIVHGGEVVLNPRQQSSLVMAMSNGGGAPGRGDVNVTVNGSNLDAHDVAREVAWALGGTMRIG